MEPFKSACNEDRIRQTGHHLRRAWSEFDEERFAATALAGLDALELKVNGKRSPKVLKWCTRELPAGGTSWRGCT